MWKQLFAIFQKDTLLDKAYKQSYDMLAMTREMFKDSKNSLRDHDTNELAESVCEKDIQINRSEREVRRNVLNHLTVAGGDEVYASMVLISVIIDIERIGDYTKNVLELARNHPEKLLGGDAEEDLKKVEAAVEDAFMRVPRQFETSDVADAENMLKEYLWVSKICDEHAIRYIKSEDKSVSSSDAVSLALYFRYLKRINAHLRNIATSVVNPFDQIGFTHKLKKKFEKQREETE